MVNPHPHTLTLSHSSSHTLTITLTLSHPHIVTLTLSHPHTTSREPSSVSAKPAPEEMQGSLEDTGVTQLNPIKVDIKYVLYNTPLHPHTITFTLTPSTLTPSQVTGGYCRRFCYLQEDKESDKGQQFTLSLRGVVLGNL